MSRVQVSDNFGGQSLTTHARPVAAMVQAAQPQEDTRWRALADVFAQGAGLAETVSKQAEQDDRQAAQKWAQSMTVGELGKAIKEGRMMPSQSPVFVGTVQHIYGVNTHEAGMRDMTTKLTTGELKFNSAEEADNYLTEWRNTSLAGQSKYAAAGFDKAYAQTRTKVLDQVTRLNDKTWIDNAQVQASDFLANSLNQVAGPDFKGTPQEAAAQLMSQYQLMRHTKTLPDGAANTAQVSGALRRYSTLLAHSSQYGDAEAAVSAASDYIASDKVSAKINGTLYLRSELPTAPATRSAEDWFSRYLDAVPKARAKELFGKDSDVRLEFDPTIRAYRAFVLGMPLTNSEGGLMVSTRNDIQAWYTQQLDADVQEAVATQSAPAKQAKQRAADTERRATRKADMQKAADRVEGIATFLKPHSDPLPEIDMTGITNPDRNARPGQRREAGR